MKRTYSHTSVIVFQILALIDRLLLDTTSVDTYSSSPTSLATALVKSWRDHLLKQLTIMSVENLQPIGFEQEHPDAISMRNTIMRMQALGDLKPLVVTNNGFHNEENCTLFKYDIPFLLRMSVKSKTDLRAVQELQKRSLIWQQVSISFRYLWHDRKG